MNATTSFEVGVTSELEAHVQFWSSAQNVLVSAGVGASSCEAARWASRILSTRLSQNYRAKDEEGKLNWDRRWAATLHAVVLSAAAVYLICLTDLYWDTNPSKVPPILRTSPATTASLGYSLGFFLVDLYLLLAYPSAASSPEMLVHHMAAIAAVAASLYQGQASNYTLTLLATEMTTPFVNMLYWLQETKQKKSTLYSVNGAALLVIWTVSRIALFPLFFSHLAWRWYELRLVSWLTTALVTLVPVMLFILNVMWYVRIVKGALKVFGGKGASKAAAQGQGQATTSEVDFRTNVFSGRSKVPVKQE